MDPSPTNQPEGPLTITYTQAQLDDYYRLSPEDKLTFNLKVQFLLNALGAERDRQAYIDSEMLRHKVRKSW